MAMPNPSSVVEEETSAATSDLTNIITNDEEFAVPIPIQTFLWRQTCPFIRPRLGKLHEATCVVWWEPFSLFSHEFLNYTNYLLYNCARICPKDELNRERKHSFSLIGVMWLKRTFFVFFMISASFTILSTPFRIVLSVSRSAPCKNLTNCLVFLLKN